MEKKINKMLDLVFDNFYFEYWTKTRFDAIMDLLTNHYGNELADITIRAISYKLDDVVSNVRHYTNCFMFNGDLVNRQPLISDLAETIRLNEWFYKRATQEN